VQPGNEFYENVRDDEKRVKEMPAFSTRNGKHGMLMDVFADKIVLSRWNFEPKEVFALGPDWKIPLPFSESAPFSFAARSAKAVLPKFPKDAKLKVTSIDGENANKEKHRQVIVEFPVATDGGRVFDYEVRVSGLSDVKKSLVRKVMSPTFHLPRKNDRGNVTCVFAASEVSSESTFTVYPRTSFGTLGKPLTATVKI
jgi:hypothetical protein